MVLRYEMGLPRDPRSALLAALLAATAPFVGACATLAGGGGGDVDLPSAAAGPFRALTQDELGNSRSAPNALFDDKTSPRDGSIVDLDGDPSTFDVAGFFAANLKDDPAGSLPARIVRYGAIDARSFDRSATSVLEPSEAWEGGWVGSPSALRRDQEIWLYYAAEGGIGLARSADEGMTFKREPAPVLAPDAASWDKGAAPRSPGVVILWDGSFRMFYEVDPDGDGRSVIGEARSDDGLVWTRIGSGAALEPSPTPPAGSGSSSSEEPPYDDKSVGSPFPVIVTSATGERVLRLYYGAESTTAPGVVGLAARFGADGALERALSPVFGAGKSLAPTEPCALVYDGFSLLFATQKSGVGDETLAVAAGVSPGNARLPPPNPL